jgi:cytoskeleton protein RodZ
MEPEPPDRSSLLASFSTWLVRERELRGLSRGDVLRSTRLALAVVEALESGEPSRLPPRAYVLGYLRSYAAAVGLDPDEVVLRFEEAVGPGKAGTGRRRPRAIPWVAALVLAAAAVGAVWAWLRW